MDGPTHLERIGPKGWLRYVFPFQLAEDYDIDEVSRIFKAGFDAAKQRLPAMSSESVPAPEYKRVYSTTPPPLSLKTLSTALPSLGVADVL